MEIDVPVVPPGCPDGACMDLRPFARDAPASSSMVLDEVRISARVEGSALRLGIPVVNKTMRRFGGHLAANLVNLETREVSAFACSGIVLNRGVESYELVLDAVPAAVIEGELAKYGLAIRLNAGTETVIGIRSLHECAESMRVRVFGQDTFFEGERGCLRVMVSSPDGNPVEGASVHARLLKDGSEFELYSGLTDSTGSALARLDMPAGIRGKGILSIVAGCVHGLRRIETEVRLVSACHTLISTDKPIYRPGQRIMVRSLTMTLPGYMPLSHAPLVLEIEDSRRNKICRESSVTDAFGAASIALSLAEQVNTGIYTIRAVQGASVSEKQVEVREYEPPKFDVRIRPDADSVKPGGTLSGVVEARHFFGRPVSLSAIRIDAFKSGAVEALFARISGKTGESGCFRFSLAVPSDFDPADLESGRASVRVSAAVFDAVSRAECAEVRVPVSQGGLSVRMISLCDPILPGVRNPFCVAVTPPCGAPAQVKCYVGLEGTDPECVFTDENGAAFVSLAPASPGAFRAEVCAVSGSSKTLAGFAFDASKGAALQVRTDKAVYRTGETAAVEVLSSLPAGTVFVDLVKEGRPLAGITIAMDGTSGRASLPLEACAIGLVRIVASCEAGSGLISAGRAVFIRKETDLRVSVVPDREEYAPGGVARLKFSVTDEAGAPVVSSIGFSAVDESVLRLAEPARNPISEFFCAGSGKADPASSLPGFSVADAIGIADGVLMQRAAEAALAAFKSRDAWSLEYDSIEAGARKALETNNAFFTRDAGSMQRFIELHSIKSAAEFDAVLASSPSADKPPRCDPWGQAYGIAIGYYPGYYYDFGDCIIKSPGMDELVATADDCSYYFTYFVSKNGWPIPVPPPGPGPMPVPSPSAPGPDGGAEVRVREHFPETLYFEPFLVTGPDGTAEAEIPLADSITTWRIEGLASSMGGCAGAVRGGIRVFQPFFIRVDLPPVLTQGDRFTLPVAVFNYLSETQEVAIEIERGDWFEVLGESSKRVQVPAQTSAGSGFDIRVLSAGPRSIRVDARGSGVADAVRVSTRARPNGLCVPFTASGVIEGPSSCEVRLPDLAMPGGTDAQVRICAHPAAQAIEGLDSLIRLPYG